MRDGVNIAQKTEKKQTVPYGEIMSLGIGEAFISFPGMDSVAKVKFEGHGESLSCPSGVALLLGIWSRIIGDGINFKQFGVDFSIPSA